MYILLKQVKYYPFVHEFLKDAGCNIIKVNTIKVDLQLAKNIYNNMLNTPYYEKAINSINENYCIIIEFEHNHYTIQDCKKFIQGSYNTDDVQTIRGYFKNLNKINGDIDNLDDSYVHIPDTEQKMNEDLMYMYEYFF